MYEHLTLTQNPRNVANNTGDPITAGNVHQRLLCVGLFHSAVKYPSGTIADMTGVCVWITISREGQTAIRVTLGAKTRGH